MTEQALSEKLKGLPPSDEPYTVWVAKEDMGDRIAVFAVHTDSGRPLRVCHAGVTFYCSPRSDRAELERLGAPYGLHFSIDGGPQPEVPFYPAPALEVFAWDAEGWLGCLDGSAAGEDGFSPLAYIRRDGTVFHVAEDPRAFIVLLQAGGDWRAQCVPQTGVQVFPSRAAAEAELDFLDLPLDCEKNCGET